MEKAPAGVAKPVNPRILDGVADNTQLMHLHEPSLLFNLRYRYSKDLIYTYTGALQGWRCMDTRAPAVWPAGHRTRGG